MALLGTAAGIKISWRTDSE